MSSETQRIGGSDVDLALARARLLEQRTRLLDRLGDSAPHGDDGITATHGSGETEHIVLGVERGISAALEAGLRNALEDVAAALARLDDGSYGLYATCGLWIAPERLEVMPETAWCVACQAERQRA